MKQQLQQLLTNLADELGDCAYVMPPDALHMTLCEVIGSREYEIDKQQLYDEHASDYINMSAEILSKYSPIDVTFDKIEVSPYAIIIKGTDDGSFESIRSELADTLPLPNGTKMPPKIIHSSIVRFHSEVPLFRIKKIIDRHSIDFVETVSEFQLVHSTVTPLLKYETIQRYPLNKK